MVAGTEALSSPPMLLREQGAAPSPQDLPHARAVKDDMCPMLAEHCGRLIGHLQTPHGVLLVYTVSPIRRTPI